MRTWSLATGANYTLRGRGPVTIGMSYLVRLLRIALSKDLRER